MSLLFLNLTLGCRALERGVCALLLGAMLLPAQVYASQDQASEPLKIVVSIRPLALLAKDLLGELAEVYTVVPPNADPHNLSLKVSDRVELDSADIVFWLGPDFERFLAKAITQRSVSHDLAIGSIVGHPGAGVASHHVHAHHDDGDAHLWLNPELALAAVKELYQRSTALRPEYKPELDERLRVVEQKIRSVSSLLSERLQPLKKVKYVVLHDAYRHFSTRFQLSPAVVVSTLPEQRLSARQLYELQQKAEGASCLLVDQQNERAERLAKVLRLSSMEADPLASDEGIGSYGEFLLGLGKAFERCLRGADKKQH